MRKLVVHTDSNGQNALALPTSTDINGVVLAANIAESITIPAGAKFVLFNATADFYVNFTGTAAVMVDTTDGSGSELNPTIRKLHEDDTISVISATAGAIVSAAFYG